MLPLRFSNLELDRVKYRHSLLLLKLYWDYNPGHKVTRLCKSNAPTTTRYTNHRYTTCE